MNVSSFLFAAKSKRSQEGAQGDEEMQSMNTGVFGNLTHIALCKYTVGLYTSGHTFWETYVFIFFNNNNQNYEMKQTMGIML